MMSPVLAAAPAPDVTLKDLAGRARNINEYVGHGRWTVVMVWSADCPICRRKMYHMTFLHEEYKDKDIQVVGLSVDGYGERHKVQDFIDEQSIAFPTLIGTPADVNRLSRHRLSGVPTYYFFAPDGGFGTVRVGALTQRQAEYVLKTLGREPGRR